MQKIDRGSIAAARALRNILLRNGEDVPEVTSALADLDPDDLPDQDPSEVPSEAGDVSPGLTWAGVLDAGPIVRSKVQFQGGYGPGAVVFQDLENRKYYPGTPIQEYLPNIIAVDKEHLGSAEAWIHFQSLRQARSHAASPADEE